jgi:hypothetical protein
MHRHTFGQMRFHKTETIYKDGQFHQLWQCDHCPFTKIIRIKGPGNVPGVLIAEDEAYAQKE